MRRQYFLALIIMLLLLGTDARAQWLKIYHLGVGQGDCTLIIANDTDNDKTRTRSVLIDGGYSVSKDKMKYIWKYIRDTVAEYSNTGLNYIVVSHFHRDHVAGMIPILEQMTACTTCPSGAAPSAWSRNVWIIDRFAFGKKYTPTVDDCFDYEGSNTVDDYDNTVETTYAGRRLRITSGTNLFAGLKDLSMICTASNGEVGGIQLAVPKSSGRKEPLSENDMSFAFVIRFKKFRYYTAGDAGGGGGGYVNLEGPILTYMSGLPGIGSTHVCAFKADHHGSAHSTNDDFVRRAAPRVCVIESALRTFKTQPLPSEKTLQKLTAAGCDIRYTYVSSNTTDPSKGKPTKYRDVILYLDNSSFPSGRNDVVMTFVECDRDKDTFAPIQQGPTCVRSQVTCSNAANQ